MLLFYKMAINSPPLRCNEEEKNYLISDENFLDFLESKIDNDLGYYFWKKYIAAAFWAQISTPLNLMITIMTALTTAQSTSSGFLSPEVYRDISVATLLFTVINTFFTPLAQLNKSVEIVKKWNALGMNFEEIFYSVNKYENINEYIEKYKALQTEINVLRDSEGPDSINFVTDLIHTISVCSCLRGYDKWLSNDRMLMRRKIDIIAGRFGISPCCDEGGCCNPTQVEIPGSSEAEVQTEKDSEKTEETKTLDSMENGGPEKTPKESLENKVVESHD